MTTTLDLNAIEAAAIAAGGDDAHWTHRTEALRGGAYGVVVIPGAEETIDVHEDDNGIAVAAHIASADPATVLALVRRIRELEGKF